MRLTALFIVFFAVFSLVMGPFSLDGTGMKSALAADDAEAGAPEFEYFEMNPVMIPIITPRGLSQQVSFVISIEVPYGKINDITAYEPRLADAYIQDLYGVLGAGYGLVNGNVLNVQAIKQRLSFVTSKVVGDAFPTDVLLQVVQQRPL